MWQLIFYHGLYIDLWCPLWPNLAASAACSGLVYVRLRIHQERHHEALKQHVTDTVGGNSADQS